MKNVTRVTWEAKVMRSLDSNFSFRGMKRRERSTDLSSGGASQLIRAAERLAGSGRFDSAMEQLQTAQKLDPNNKYIQAIMDRIRFQQNPGEPPSPLSVTVGRQFPGGIKSHDEDETLSPDQIHSRVRSLTSMAEQFLEKGSSDKAFEALMKAYLLDPLSPYVIASEKTVLPAWEFSRTHHSGQDSGRSTSAGSSISFSETGTLSMASANPGPLKNPLSPQSGALSPSDEQLRMELLKQQKERERFEKERAVWREASKAPKIFGENDQQSNSPSQENESQKPQTGSLFSRLKLGKFLE